MSENSDQEKTEEATEKRVRDALERGERPVSRDLSGAVMLLALFFAFSFFWQGAALRLGALFKRLFEGAGRIRVTSQPEVVELGRVIGMQIAMALGPLLLILCAVALAAQAAQGEFRFVGKRILPDPARISPFSGFQRIYSIKGLIEFAKSAAKLVISALIVFSILRGYTPAILESAMVDASALGPRIAKITLAIIMGVALTMLGVGLLDLLQQRFSWMRRLRMSRQEIKDELKQSEGDPIVKGRLRALAADRARRRMLADVERATLVVANPTHFAIAMRYVREEGGAPLVIAKGQDLIALKIRERAESLGIPVIENPPLARAMYGQVETGQMIPQQFYGAIAGVINLLASGKSRS